MTPAELKNVSSFGTLRSHDLAIMIYQSICQSINQPSNQSISQSMGGSRNRISIWQPVSFTTRENLLFYKGQMSFHRMLQDKPAKTMLGYRTGPSNWSI